MDLSLTNKGSFFPSVFPLPEIVILLSRYNTLLFYQTILSMFNQISFMDGGYHHGGTQKESSS